MILPSVEIETAADPRHAVIWLHGLGADGHDFEPLVPELVAPDWPALRFVFPHAPQRAVTINNGMHMRAWYDIAGADLASRQDEGGVRESIAQVEALIARENGRGVPSDNIVLAGFSQGGAIALAAGLRHAQRLAGIIALSTYLPIHESTTQERAPANADVPLFMAHGSADPVVPMQLGTFSRDHLIALGYKVDWHSYPMGHQLCAPQVVDLREWIGRRLAG